jgi:hypothetical protein
METKQAVPSGFCGLFKEPAEDYSNITVLGKRIVGMQDMPITNANYPGVTKIAGVVVQVEFYTFIGDRTVFARNIMVVGDADLGTPVLVLYGPSVMVPATWEDLDG